MATYTNPDGRVFTIPTYSDFSDGPQNFKDFAATMPSYGNDVYDVSGTVQFTAHHTSRVVKFTAAGEYVVDDTAPTGTQVTVATWNAFVSVMTSGVQVEPAAERLIPPYSMVILTKVGAGMWLVAKGSGGAGNYFNNAAGGTVTEISDYNGSGELWRVHTFTGNGSLEVLDSQQPFRVLVVGGGGPGGPSPNDSSYIGGGGGGGGVYENSALQIEVGPHAVVIGDGGSPGNWPYGQAPITGLRSAQPSSIEVGGVPIQSGGGGSGGNGPNGGRGAATNGANGGPNGYLGGSTGSGPGKSAVGGTGGNVTSDISGAALLYSKPNDNSVNYRGWSGGPGKKIPGTHGVVVVAYQIG